MLERLERRFVEWAVILLGLTVWFLAGCSRASSTRPPKQRLGSVMVEVGRRFEVAGRASGGNRFELAEYEVSEIEEVFETDIPGAEMPAEGPTAHIVPMAKAFLETNVPELKRAAAAKDRAAFADAFRRAASACNACHAASAKAFIVVPSEPGRAMPDVEPLPAAPAGSR
jgi:mono/diheme cytochrome c family protein